MGLLLERYAGEAIHIQFDQDMSAEELDELLRSGITIRVVELRVQGRQKAKLNIDAPQCAGIWRAELLQQA